MRKRGIVRACDFASAFTLTRKLRAVGELALNFDNTTSCAWLPHKLVDSKISPAPARFAAGYHTVSARATLM